jgi:hypothetical protein
MDEDSAVRYWEGYGKIAFDAGTSPTSLFSKVRGLMNRPKKYIYHNNPQNPTIPHSPKLPYKSHPPTSYGASSA